MNINIYHHHDAMIVIIPRKGLFWDHDRMGFFIAAIEGAAYLAEALPLNKKTEDWPHDVGATEFPKEVFEQRGRFISREVHVFVCNKDLMLSAVIGAIIVACGCGFQYNVVNAF